MLVPEHLCAVAAHVLKVGCVWMPFTAVLFFHLTTLLMTFSLSKFCFLSSFHPTPSQSSHLLYQHLCTCPSLLSFLTPVPPPPDPSNSLTLVSSLYFTRIFLHSPPPRVPGGLADEHHHHRQLHEQVQPSVLVPAAAQAHGVEPP